MTGALGCRAGGRGHQWGALGLAASDPREGSALARVMPGVGWTAAGELESVQPASERHPKAGMPGSANLLRLLFGRYRKRWSKFSESVRILTVHSLTANTR